MQVSKAAADRKAPVPRRASPQRPRGFRALAEWLALLALAVVVLRTFAVEGFMISTGSMAPCLLGYHRRVVCPTCGFEFEQGVPAAPDAGLPDTRLAWAAGPNVAESYPADESATCPNCGSVVPHVDRLPRTEGDQLLVHKHAFTWREWLGRGGLRRWEVAVFRNPDDESRPYVKRVVGLPGERIELIRGDVYADAALQRKPLPAQLGTRVPVDKHDCLPDDGEQDPDWAPRWVIAGEGSHWGSAGSRFVFRGVADSGSQSAEMEWIDYRHWVRHGGTHRTSVPLDSWPEGIDLPHPVVSPLEYRAEARELTCLGALPFRIWEEWDAATEDAAFRVAIRELFQRSHVAPITDVYVYNRAPDVRTAFDVRDLMLELQADCSGRSGELVLELSDGVRAYQAVLDFGNNEIRLQRDDAAAPLRRARLPAAGGSGPRLVQWSTFDRQLLLALDGAPACAPVECDVSTDIGSGTLHPARIGARGLHVTIDHLALYRDVYYTPPDDLRHNAWNVARDEYFVLGDNSQVSVDSRHWQSPGVARSLLIGKPLLVHLPSRPGTVRWGNQRRQIRVPDFSRIRYIR